MRKTLLFLFAAVLSVSGAMAQNAASALLKSPVRNDFQPAFRAPVTSHGEAWWGYVSEDSDVSGLGVSSVDKYHCAIFIPGDDAVAAGKTIKAAHFAILGSNYTDVKAWIATSLPNELNDETTERLVSVSAKGIKNGEVEVEFPEPYAIGSEGVYVGYSFSVTKISTQNDNYPVAVAGDEDAEGALILRTESRVPEWSDLNGNGYGRLYLQVLLEGDFEDNLVDVTALGNGYAVLGQQGTLRLRLTSNGLTTVSNIDYTIEADGKESEPKRLDIPGEVGFLESVDVQVKIDADAATGSQAKKLKVVKVNGNDNQSASNEADFTLYTVPRLVERGVAVEEFTGTGCGWCPRGIVGMEKLRHEFGDRFVGIAIHQYNVSSDAMGIATTSYARLGFTGAPSCKVNRGDIIDPYYGSRNSIIDDFREQLEIPALAELKVSGQWNADSSKVEAKAEVLPLIEGETYTIEFVLVGDSLQGTGTTWNQSNYYYQYSASQVEDDIAPFASGGIYGKSSVTGYKYNDAALSSSYSASKNRAVLEDDLTSAYTLSLPTKATLKAALKKEYIYLVALLIDSEGHVANAAKVEIDGADEEALGISTATQSAGNGAVISYSIDGRQLPAARKGLQLQRLSDGTVRKVFVK